MVLCGCLCLGSVLTWALPILLVIWEFLLPLLREHFPAAKLVADTAMIKSEGGEDDSEESFDECCSRNEKENCANKKNE